MKRLRKLLAGLCLMGMMAAVPAGAEPIRIGVLQFGTVNWEMDTITHHGLDKAGGIELQLQPLASSQALKIALQGGAVDVVVADWIWVARQRAAGQKLSFVPYSTSVGGVVVSRKSSARLLSDLAGKRIGIGGGPLDKTWLLLQAMALQYDQKSLDETTDQVFGAPPLINQQLDAGEVEIAINYWHYVARLEIEGHLQLWTAQDLMHALGVGETIPFLGFVFPESWGRAHPDSVKALAEASRQAKERLCRDAAEWKRIAPLVKAETGRLSSKLRKRFCEGVPKQWGDAERAAAAKVFDILRRQGGEQLVGQAESLDPDTFWPDIRY